MRVPGRFVAFVAAMMVVGSALPAAAAPPLFAGFTRHGCLAPQEVRTLRVVTEWPKKTYKTGDIAKVKVTVTRPGPKDPANAGIVLPDVERFPVEGAEVSTAVFNVFPPVAGRAQTDENGVATVKFEVQKHLRGSYDTFTDARVYHRTVPAGPDCTDILERGFSYDPDSVRAKG